MEIDGAFLGIGRIFLNLSVFDYLNNGSRRRDLEGRNIYCGGFITASLILPKLVCGEVVYGRSALSIAQNPPSARHPGILGEIALITCKPVKGVGGSANS